MRGKLIAVLVATCCAVGPAARRADGEEKDWSIELDAALNSKYVWRGINLVDDWVFQPSVTGAYRGLSLNVWGNMELSNENVYPGHGDAAGDFTEIDYTLDYSWAWRRLNFSLGTIYYDFPNTGLASTLELYGAVGLDAPLAPTLTVYQDVKEADGTYAALSVSHAFEDVWSPAEGVAVSLDLGASVAAGSSNFNKFYYGVDDEGLADLLLSVGLPVRLGERWTLRPSASFSTLLDDDIRSSVSDASNAWYGVSLGCAF